MMTSCSIYMYIDIYIDTEPFFSDGYGTLHALLSPIRDVDIFSLQIFGHELVGFFCVFFIVIMVLQKKLIFVTFILRETYIGAIFMMNLIATEVSLQYKNDSRVHALEAINAFRILFSHFNSNVLKRCRYIVLWFSVLTRS